MENFIEKSFHRKNSDYYYPSFHTPFPSHSITQPSYLLLFAKSDDLITADHTTNTLKSIMALKTGLHHTIKERPPYHWNIWVKWWFTLSIRGGATLQKIPTPSSMLHTNIILLLPQRKEESKAIQPFADRWLNYMYHNADVGNTHMLITRGQLWLIHELNTTF